jgi:hypothetical protein
MEHFVLINKKLLNTDSKKAVQIFGSIKELSKENLKINNRIIKYDTLFKLLGENKYFNNDDYLIRKSLVQRSKMNF